MPEAKHTPEPWAVATHDGYPFIVTDTPKPYTVAEVRAFTIGCGDDNPDDGQADAARIVACVNALAGLNPEAVALIRPTLSAIARRAQIAQGAIDAGELGHHGASGDVDLIVEAAAALLRRLNLSLDSSPDADLPLAKLEAP